MENKNRLIDVDRAYKYAKEQYRDGRFSDEEYDAVLQTLDDADTVDAWIPPCKPGNTVYFIMCRTDGNHEIKKGFALRVEYSCSNRPLITIRYDDYSLASTKHYLGLKAFMTEEEAEEALAKMVIERGN